MSRPHNIAGTEAFSPGPKVMISELPPRRPPLSEIARLYLCTAIVAMAASLIDAAIGAPVCWSIVSVTFLVTWLRG